MTALAFLSKHWRALILTGGVASLILAVILARADARQCHQRDAQHVAALNLEVQKNAINLASIAELEAALKAKEADTAARANAFADSQTQNAASTATADARRAADKGRIDTLNKLATTLPSSPDCTAPSALLNNLKGL
jgi:membrane protein involved in colicin uptake